MKFFLIVFSCVFSSQLFAQGATTGAAEVNTKFSCVNIDITRRVEIEYETAGKKVPCFVNYFKDQEDPGVAKVLWRSENEEGYCEEKVSVFLEKLKGWGWSCSP